MADRGKILKRDGQEYLITIHPAAAIYNRNFRSVLEADLSLLGQEIEKKQKNSVHSRSLDNLEGYAQQREQQQGPGKEKKRKELWKREETKNEETEIETLVRSRSRIKFRTMFSLVFDIWFFVIYNNIYYIIKFANYFFNK